MPSPLRAAALDIPVPPPPKQPLLEDSSPTQPTTPTTKSDRRASPRTVSGGGISSISSTESTSTTKMNSSMSSNSSSNNNPSTAGTSSESTFANHHLGDNGGTPFAAPPEPLRRGREDSSGLLRKTERCFLRQDYKGSLGLVVRHFRALHNHESQPELPQTPSSGCTAREFQAFHPNHAPTPDSVLATTVTEPWIADGRLELVPPMEIPYERPDEELHRFHNESEPTNNNTLSLTFVARVTAANHSTTTSTEDKMAVMGLQSWYELSRMEERQQQQSKQRHLPHSSSTETYRWSLLAEILGHYATPHPSDDTPAKGSPSEGSSVRGTPFRKPPPRGVLSMEVLATVWISFWESQGFGAAALLWTVQALHEYHRVCAKDAVSRALQPSETSSLAQDLWLRCVCQQLPRCLPRNNPAQKALLRRLVGLATEPNIGCLDRSEWEALWEDLRRAIDEEEPGSDICDNDNVPCLLECLDGYLGDGKPCGVSPETLLRARNWLSQQIQGQETPSDNEEEKKSNESALTTDAHCSYHNQNVSEKNRLTAPAGKGTIHACAAKESAPAAAGMLSPPPPTDSNRLVRVVYSALDALPQRLRWPFQALVATVLRSFPNSFSALPVRVYRMVASALAQGFSIPTSDAVDASSQNSQLQESFRTIHWQQALLAIAIGWGGWKTRKLLSRLVRALVWTALVPLRDVAEALGLSSAERTADPPNK